MYNVLVFGSVDNISVPLFDVILFSYEVDVDDIISPKVVITSVDVSTGDAMKHTINLSMFYIVYIGIL